MYLHTVIQTSTDDCQRQQQLLLPEVEEIECTPVVIVLLCSLFQAKANLFIYLFTSDTDGSGPYWIVKKKKRKKTHNINDTLNYCRDSADND